MTQHTSNCTVVHEKTVLGENMTLWDKKRGESFDSPLVVKLCGGRDSNSHRLTPTTPSK